MDTEEAYNTWASQYDTNDNKTRDLEGQALRSVLASINFDRCLEIGCGTGKNTEWLVQHAKEVMAVDLSEEMLKRAIEKVPSDKVKFKQADITTDWSFTDGLYDLVTFSLVLEHIENLDAVFNKAGRALRPGGCIYVGELHPFKQYTGTKARFDTGQGRQIVQCYDHHISDFVRSAKRTGLKLIDLEEYFDEPYKGGVPRILVLLFKKI